MHLSPILVIGTALDGSGTDAFELRCPTGISPYCLFAEKVIVDPAGLFRNSSSVIPS